MVLLAIVRGHRARAMFGGNERGDRAGPWRGHRVRRPDSTVRRRREVVLARTGGVRCCEGGRLRGLEARPGPLNQDAVDTYGASARGAARCSCSALRHAARRRGSDNARTVTGYRLRCSSCSRGFLPLVGFVVVRRLEFRCSSCSPVAPSGSSGGMYQGLVQMLQLFTGGSFGSSGGMYQGLVQMLQLFTGAPSGRVVRGREAVGIQMLQLFTGVPLDRAGRRAGPGTGPGLIRCLSGCWFCRVQVVTTLREPG